MSDAFPMQPLIKDKQGVVRFQKNAVVEYLLDHGGIDMNRLAMLNLPDTERAHFAQLIGYSLCGYHELPYVTDAAALAASEAARQQWPDAGGCRDGEGCPIHSDRYQGEEEEENEEAGEEPPAGTPRIRTACLFSNGMVAVFDEHGQQIPFYQGRAAAVVRRIDDNAPAATRFVYGDWRGSGTPLRRSEWLRRAQGMPHSEG